MALSDTKIAVPETQKITVGSGEDKREYVIAPFKMGKTLIILERISHLLEEKAVSQLLTNGNVRSVFFSLLPQLLTSARPKLFELLGLILIPNKEIVKLNDAGTLGERITELTQQLEVDAEIEDAFAILNAGIDAMGLETIQGNVKRLSAKFKTNSPVEEVKTPTE